MKKILLIGPIIGNLKGFRGELIQVLLDNGYDVTLATSYTNKEIADMDRRLHFYNVQIDRRDTSIISDLKLCFRYARLLYAVKPDCVLTYTTKCSVYGGLVCSLKGIPYIVNNSGLYNKNDFGKIMWFILNTLYKLGYTNARCLMHQNSYEQEYLDAITRYKPKSMLLPGSGVNLNTYAYQPYPPYDGKVILNYMARIVNIKGIYELIDAVKQIKVNHPELELRLYGAFETDEYKALVKNAELDGLLKYCGVTKDVPTVIKTCHGVVHPSYYEGMTNVILEHSAMGRPCLGSDIPGVKEGIEDGKTGFLFKVKDSKALAESLERFLNLDHKEREQMGVRAREKMVKQFDRQIIVDKYMQEIKNILDL